MEQYRITERGPLLDEKGGIGRPGWATELLYAYDQLGDSDCLREAERLTRICLEGWDYTCREDGTEYGGIPWGPAYQTKHTCSNAPIVWALVRLYEIHRAAGNEQDGADDLEWARRIYAFVKDHLRNPDGTYGDLLGSQRVLEGSGGAAHYVTTGQAAEGDIDHTAYTYNTGAMISGGAALYRATGEESYLEDAKAAAQAADAILADHSQIEGCSLYSLKDTTVWFQLVLLEGYLELAPYDDACQAYLDGMAGYWRYTYEQYNRDGFLPRNGCVGWDPANEKDTAKDIMDQAASAQIFAVLAEYYGAK